MLKIQKGDTLILKNGNQVTAVSSVFKMNSLDPNYYAVAVDTATAQIPVDIRSIAAVWRGAEPLLTQLELFAEGAK